jgi:predicted phage-related endonuclease
MTVAHQVPGMSFDEQRLEDRRKTLGASEIPAVAGVNPHRSALDVYLEKKGLAEPFAGNAFTEWGLRMEEPIAQKYAEVIGLPVVTSDTIVARGWMSATPDRLVAGIRNVATWKLDKSGRPLWKGIAEALGATKPENSTLVQQHTSPPGRRFRLLIGED